MCDIVELYTQIQFLRRIKLWGILFWDHVRKHKSDDNKYLEYRKNTKIFYTDESLEYLKKERLRIETRLEDRKQDNAYSAIAAILAFITLAVTLVSIVTKIFYFFVAIIAMFILLAFGIYRKDECTQCRIALQVLDELIAEKEESKTVNGAKQYNVTIVSK